MGKVIDVGPIRGRAGVMVGDDGGACFLSDIAGAVVRPVTLGKCDYDFTTEGAEGSQGTPYKLRLVACDKVDRYFRRISGCHNQSTFL